MSHPDPPRRTGARVVCDAAVLAVLWDGPAGASPGVQSSGAGRASRCRGSAPQLSYTTVVTILFAVAREDPSPGGGWAPRSCTCRSPDERGSRARRVGGDVGTPSPIGRRCCPVRRRPCLGDERLLRGPARRYGWGRVTMRLAGNLPLSCRALARCAAPYSALDPRQRDHCCSLAPRAGRLAVFQLLRARPCCRLRPGALPAGSPRSALVAASSARPVTRGAVVSAVIGRGGACRRDSRVRRFALRRSRPSAHAHREAGAMPGQSRRSSSMSIADAYALPDAQAGSCYRRMLAALESQGPPALLRSRSARHLSASATCSHVLGARSRPYRQPPASPRRGRGGLHRGAVADYCVRRESRGGRRRLSSALHRALLLFRLIPPCPGRPIPPALSAVFSCTRPVGTPCRPVPLRSPRVLATPLPAPAPSASSPRFSPSRLPPRPAP